MSTGSRANEGSIKVVTKAAALLDALAAGQEMTASELATAIDEPRSTIYRIINALSEQGYVEGTGDRGRYVLGLKLLGLGNAVARRFEDIRGVALPFMKNLHAATGQTIYLAIRREWDAVCIERVDGTLVQLLILPVGGSLPLHAGAVSKALLAFEPQEVIEEFLGTKPAKLTPKTKTGKRALLEEFGQVVEQGYALSEEDVIPGIGAIGVPIFDSEARVRASLSIAGPQSVVLGDDFDRICGLTRQAGAELSKRLGYPGPT